MAGILKNKSVELGKSKDCCRDAWIAGVHCADRIFKETVRNAMEELSEREFMIWLGGFVKEK